MKSKWTLRLTSDPSLGLGLLRALLGMALLVRGAMLVSQPDLISQPPHADPGWLALSVSHYSAGAHLCGGILLTLGLGARIAALLQVPALTGAAVFILLSEGALRATPSLAAFGMGLCLLIVISLFGAGRFSLDAVFEQQEEELEPESSRAPAASRVH